MRILATLLLIGTMPVMAQELPSWVNPLMRLQKFPETEYFTGFATQYFTKDDDLNQVKDKTKSLARAGLSESIMVNIVSQSMANLKNVNGESAEDYTKSVVTSSSLQTMGLKVEEFVDNKRKLVYAFASVKRSKLLASYYQLLSSQMNEVKFDLERASEMEDKGNAYSAYLDIIKKLEGLKSTQNALRILGAKSDVVLQLPTWKAYFLQAEEKAEQLRKSKDISLEEAAHFLADKLILDLDDHSALIVMGNITYKNTDMASEFSSRLRLLMLESFRSKGLRVSESVNRGGVMYFLNGSYWPGNDKIQVSAEIKEQHDSEIVRVLAGGSIFISTEVMEQEGISLTPLNFQKAVTQTQTIQATKLPDEGIHVDLFTNKAGNGQIYHEGDILQVSVRINHPAYLRLFDVMSDGRILLLMDNKHIGESQTNRIINLDDQFQAQCPCGVEYLHLLAQTVPFDDLETYDEGGFTFVEESLESVIKKSRGFGKVKSTGYGFSEQTITVTTLPR